METRGQKLATVGFLRLKGKPRYVKGREPIEQPKVFADELIFCSLTLIGTIIDLAEFTFRPVDSANELRIALSKKSYLVSPCIKIKVSSAYCKIWKS